MEGTAVLLLAAAWSSTCGTSCARYQPDALRYFIAVAGPETQDTDFTWTEFVRRTNDELVAGWGNLVNRTASIVDKNLGSIPAAGELADADRALLATTSAGFGSVGALLGRTGRSTPSTRRCGSSARRTSTSPTRRRGS